MKNKSPVKGRIAYLAGLTPRAESVIFGSGCGGLSALEKHLPGIFVRSVEEPAQSSVLRRVELPQIEGPLLTREDPVDEHNLDYVDKLELLVHQGLDACLQSSHLFFAAPRQARLFLGREPRWGSRPELGGCDPLRVARLGDVKPPRLPPLQDLHKGALEP